MSAALSTLFSMPTTTLFPVSCATTSAWATISANLTASSAFSCSVAPTLEICITTVSAFIIAAALIVSLYNFTLFVGWKNDCGLSCSPTFAPVNGEWSVNLIPNLVASLPNFCNVVSDNSPGKNLFLSLVI